MWPFIKRLPKPSSPPPVCEDCRHFHPDMTCSSQRAQLLHARCSGATIYNGSSDVLPLVFRDAPQPLPTTFCTTQRQPFGQCKESGKLFEPRPDTLKSENVCLQRLLNS